MSKVYSREEKHKIVLGFLKTPISKSAFLSQNGIGSQYILADIPSYSRNRINSPNLQEHFFRCIDSEIKAYFLGLILTRGIIELDNVKEINRQRRMEIYTKPIEAENFTKLAAAIGLDTAITKKQDGSIRLRFRNNKIVKDLEKYHIVQRNDHNMKLPTNIPPHLMGHLFRGMFDGDGEIEDEVYKGNKQLFYINFKGTPESIQEFADYCYENIPLKNKPDVFKYEDKTKTEMEIYDLEDMAAFGNWIYKDATIYLSYKKKIFDDFKINHNLK